LAFMVAWAAGTRLVRVPIRRLVQTVEAWRRGDDTARTGIVTDASELSILAHAIDTYMNELVADRIARRAAEESRDLLLREMEHRVKNLLAIVQAVVRQTLKGEVAPQVFVGRCHVDGGEREAGWIDPYAAAISRHPANACDRRLRRVRRKIRWRWTLKWL